MKTIEVLGWFAFWIVLSLYVSKRDEVNKMKAGMDPCTKIMKEVQHEK